MTLPESEELALVPELVVTVPSLMPMPLKSSFWLQDEARNPISSAVASNFPSSTLERIAHSKVKTD